MISSVTTTATESAIVGAPRQRKLFRPSTVWSISAMTMAPKTCTHVATKDFGGNATLHPRSEEAPL